MEPLLNDKEDAVEAEEGGERVDIYSEKNKMADPLSLMVGVLFDKLAYFSIR